MINKKTTWIAGAGIGAGLMYLFDPAGGNRRRALIRDQMVHFQHKGSDTLEKAARDLKNRTAGLAAEVRSSLLYGDKVSDEVLVARVREAMGRVIRHPSAITVMVHEGRVTLTGPILDDEVDQLLKTVKAVRGVEDVNKRLEVHDQAGDVPGLQGWPERPEPRFDLLQENWAPGPRLLATANGGALVLAGLRRGGLLGATGSVLGLALVARGITNKPVKRLTGVGAGRRAVDIQKTINVDAPVEEVFAFWQNYENFPRFMSNIEKVRDLGNGRSHWVVKGPLGTTLNFNAVLTSVVPNKILAWRSDPGAMVDHAGIIRFEPNQNGGTQVNIKMSYNPPAGMAGHTVAKLFESDPKQKMDEDLVRFKSLIEEGKTSAEGRVVTREEVAEA